MNNLYFSFFFLIYNTFLFTYQKEKKMYTPKKENHKIIILPALMVAWVALLIPLLQTGNIRINLVLEDQKITCK